MGLDLTESEEQKQKGEEERRKKLEDQQAKEAAAAEAHRRTLEQQKRLEAKTEELNALMESMKVRRLPDRHPTSGYESDLPSL